MNQDDDFTKPYRKIAAAEELIEEGSLMQDYVALYKKKFRGEPLVDVGRVQIAQIKHLKSVARDRALALLHHYFTMNDPWFIQQAYSLECLIKNLHKVHASFSQRTTHHKDSGKIELQFHCDACWKEFTLVCDMHFDLLNKMVRCPPCEMENKPLKTVSKQNRRTVSQTLGSAFPKMPTGLDSIEMTE